MGTWGYDTFENDAACDWAYGLEQADDLQYVRDTLEQSLVGDGVELGSEEALAACEVLARLRGNWGVRNAYTENVDKWVIAHPQPVPADLIALANRVIEAVLNEESELRCAWDESGDAKPWLECVENLRRRVNSTPTG